MASAAATYVGLLLLTANSILVLSRSRGDAAATVFVLASYLSLVQLFCSLRRFETAAPGSVERRRARIGVWLTTALLTAMFSWRVAAVMPRPVAAGVWFVGASTVAGGFYALFSWRVAAIMPRPVAAGVWFMGASTVATEFYALFSWWVAPATIFVVTSYATLVLLFYCHRQLQTAPPADDPAAARDRARAICWVDTTLTTPVFSWRVAALLPTPIVSAAVLLMMATSTVIGGLYALFLLSLLRA